MNNLQTLADKAAIGFSLLCAIHCLVLPVGLILLPSIAALPLPGESFHLWLLVAVIPTSVYGLMLGCKQHKHYRLLATGAVGLTFMISALTMAEAYGEVWEKTLTIIGAGIIVFAHYHNYRLCRQAQTDCCDNLDELESN